MNIVVRSPNWIGDCIMSLPAIKILKNEFPGEKIIILTKEYLRDIFKNIAEISEIITIPDHSGIRNFFIARKKIKKYKFKTAVLLTKIIRSGKFNRI